MADEKEAVEDGGEGILPGSDPAAVALALAGCSREEADAFLRDQRALIADQRHHLHEQLKQIHLSIFDKWVGALLRVATLCVGVAVAGGAAVMVWDAAHSNGLIVEAFTVPPDMETHGLSGKVVAGQIIDRLSALQEATQSYRAAQSYANNWGGDIKVEIPETGISITEARRFLREWLGHDTYISGEVWRTETGVAVTARVGGEDGATFTGPASSIDALIQKAAEHVYRVTQPYRYANYIRGQRRYDEAHAIYRQLTISASQSERAWGWYGLGVLSNNFQGDVRGALWAYRKAVTENPDLTIAHASITSAENLLGHEDAAMTEVRKLVTIFSSGAPPEIAPRSRDYVRLQFTNILPFLLGDFDATARQARIGAGLPDQQGFRNQFVSYVARSLARQHDGAARAALPDLRTTGSPLSFASRTSAVLEVAVALQDWPMAMQMEAQIRQLLIRLGSQVDSDVLRTRQVGPLIALAKAKLGDVAGAETLIATTPEDCDICLRTRGKIAALAGKPAEADRWFAKAEAHAPSTPFADADWGTALLERGQPDAAIEKFTLANKKGPHFADPLEGWGEALMAKNQSHRALAKFAEAEKYAPNWGRLHLKWGEALAYSGKRDEAAKHFARAAQLDLTPAEKSELAKVTLRKRLT